MWILVAAIMVAGNPMPIATIDSPLEFSDYESCMEFGASHQVRSAEGIVVEGRCVKISDPA